ncbi:hypothetical protein ACFQPF_12460 [Fictibacillus iocasae]|uniref:Uncharacterized protein n=1 Tax=Fictibacillus iocasae TaxID=2715437 RepID=A0ABW2NTC7_9BACL
MLKNKRLVILIVFLLLSGLIGYSLINRNPPMPTVKTEGNDRVPVRQASFCWKGFFSAMCVDMAEPFMVEGREGVPVQPGETISITFNQTPLNKMETVSTWKEGDNLPKETPMDSANHFEAPREEGTYGISLNTEWNRGSVSHYFFIDVR